MSSSELTHESVSHYLRAALKLSAIREPTQQEQAVHKEQGPKKFLHSQLMAKKFRKWSADQATQARVLKAVNIAVDGQKPLQIVHPMGGYKFWKLPPSPEVDWADFFNIAYLLQYVSGIAAGYAPGVHIHYYIHTLLPQVHDNLPAADVNFYVDSFKVLVDAFSRSLPSNVKLALVKDADFYSPDEYRALLEEAYRAVEPKFDSLPVAMRDELMRWSRENIKWAGAQDWTRLMDAEREQAVRRGAIYELAGLAKMNRPHSFTQADDKVLLFTKAKRGNGVLGIGSTRSSVVKHWMGVGVLEHRAGAFYDVILSLTQLDKVAALPKTTVDCDLLPLRNLRRISVVQQHMDFSGAAPN